MSTKILRVLVYWSFAFLVLSCNEDTGIPVVQDNGLSTEINKMVPDSVLSVFKSLDMDINTGDTPPELTGMFVVDPFVLDTSTNRSDSLSGMFENMHIEFSNKIELELSVSYTQGDETGVADKAYITGSDSLFSVFFSIPSRANGEVADITHIVSGKYSLDGISNLKYALYMLDNKGNPNKIWIANSQARVFKDGDGLSNLKIE